MSRLILSLSMLLLIPLNAMALEINDKGAQTLKTSFQNMLDYQKTVNEAFGATIIDYDGELTVTQEAEFYLVTLPHIKARSPEAVKDTEDFVFDIGVITIQMIQDEKDGYWKSLLYVPNQMTMLDKITDDKLVIGFGKQEIMAIFNDRLGYFTKIDMNLSELIFNTGDEEDLGISLDEAKIYVNTSENDNGKFSGPGYLLIKNLVVSPADEDETVKIGELKFDFNMSNVKYPTLLDYKEKFQKHTETFKSLSEIEESTNVEDINGQNVMDMIFDLYNFEMDGFGFQYSLKNMEITSNDTSDKDADFTSFKLDSAFMGFSFDGLGDDKGTMQIRTGFDTINIQPSDDEIKEIMPQSLNLNIKAQNIPYNALTKMAQTSAKSIAENPESVQMVGLGLLMRLPAILSQSGTQIVVENNGIKNDVYDIKLDGKVLTDLTAIMGFSAKFKALFSGLDDLMAIANKHAANDGDYTAKFIGMLKTLNKLKELGKLEGSAYAYEFEATPEGKFLLNGQDASTISFE